jgi:hypothetical protein
MVIMAMKVTNISSDQNLHYYYYKIYEIGCEKNKINNSKEKFIHILLLLIYSVYYYSTTTKVERSGENRTRW